MRRFFYVSTEPFGGAHAQIDDPAINFQDIRYWYFDLEVGTAATGNQFIQK